MQENIIVMNEEIIKRKKEKKADNPSASSGSVGGIVTLFPCQAGTNPTNACMIDKMDHLYSVLRNVGIGSGTTEFKVALGVYIDMLEVLHNQI